MKRYFFEVFAALLFLAALGVFYLCVRFLTQRDYIAAILLTFVGFAVVRAGTELARFAMLDRS
ncbi:MAG: hypothetical protein H6707_19760 [Deltaproteobacteria bacterium]|nr:hypothetical protein [Deltaproteobacteria bacterium]